MTSFIDRLIQRSKSNAVVMDKTPISKSSGSVSVFDCLVDRGPEVLDKVR